MAAALLEIGLSNLAVAAALAGLALAAGRWGTRPALTHALWLLVLLKLVTPPVVHLHVPLLPAIPVERTAPVAPTRDLTVPGSPDSPGALENANPEPANASPKVIEVASAGPSMTRRQFEPPPKRNFNELRPKEDGSLPVKLVKPSEKPAPKPATPAPSIPLFPVEPATPNAGETQPVAAAPTSGELPFPGSPAPEPTRGADIPRAPKDTFPSAAVIVAVWLGGAAAWLALVALRVRRFARVLRLAEAAPAWFAREVEQMARELGLGRVPRVRLIPGTLAPMVWSLGRPAVFFPSELLTRLDAAQRASLIAHELAHLKRRDHVVRWVELAALALYWWCPLVWLARRELQRAEEECCDAWVVATLRAGHTYASALLDTLDFLAEAPAAPALASGMGTAATVKRRLVLILDGRTPNRLPRSGRVLLALLALGLLPVAPKLARLAGSPATETSAAEKAEAPRSPEAPAPRSKEPAAKTSGGLTSPGSPQTNPRGEPLLYDQNQTELRVRGQRFWAVALSPDGKTAATVQGSRGIKSELLVWDRETGKIKHTIPYADGIRSVAYSPDGKILATAAFDGIVRFHDADTMKIWAISDPTGGGLVNKPAGVNGLCFFKDGKYLATAGLQARNVNIWDVEAVKAKRKGDEVVTFPPVASLEGHEQRVLSVSVSSDGKTVISGSGDQTARLWDLPDALPKMGDPMLVIKKERAILRGHQNEVESVAASPDGTLFASASWDAQVFTWDRDGKRAEINGAFRQPALCVAFSKDGKYLAAGAGNFSQPGQQGEIRVWDIPGKKELAYRTDYPDAVFGVAFTPDAKAVVSVGDDHALHVWPLPDPKERQTFFPSKLAYEAQPLNALAISPDGQFLAFAGESKGIYVWNRTESKLVVELTGHTDIVTGLAFSPDGKTLASSSHDKTVKLWDTAAWTERKTLAGHTGWVFGLAFAPDGRTLATGSYDKTIRLWDVVGGDVKATLKDHSAGVRTVAFSPDGKFLASAGSDRIIRVWDVAEGKVIQQLKGHKSAVRSVTFSPDGKTLASGSEDRTVKLWDHATGKELRTLTGVPDMVTMVRYSARGQTLVASTFQGSIVVFDPVTGRKRQELAAFAEPVTGVAFADDGKQLLAVSLDRTIRQWGVVKPGTVAPAQAFAGKPWLVTAVAITPEGLGAVLGGHDGSVAVWDLKSGETQPFPNGTHPGGVALVAAGPGLRIASIGRDNKVIVGRLGKDDVWKADGRFACFTPDGKHVLIVNGKEAVLYDADSGKDVRKFTGGHDGPIQCAAFDAEGKILATAGEDTKIRLWDVATAEKKQVSPPLGNYTSIPWIGFNTEGTKLAVVANAPDMPPVDDMTGQFQVIRSVYVFALPNGPGGANAMNTNGGPPPFIQQLQQFNLEVTGAAWTRDGRGLITTSADGMVRLWNAATPQDMNGQPAQSFRGHDAGILAVGMSSDGGVFVTAGEDMAVKRWRVPGVEPPAGVARLSPPGLGRVWEALYDPNGKYFVVAGGGDRAFRVYSSLPMSMPVEPDKAQSVFGMAYSPDGKFLATGHENGAVVIRDAATGKPLRTLDTTARRVNSIAFAENGAALVTVGGNWANGKEPGVAIVWDFPEGKIRHKLEAPGYQWMVAASPDGKHAAIVCSDGKIRVWNVATGKLVNAVGKGPGLKSVAYDADGKRLVASGFDQNVHVFDAASGAEIRSIPVPQLMLSHAIFSPDGKEVVICAWKGTGQADKPPLLAAYTIDDASVPPRQFPTQPASVLSLAFLPDGKTLVAGGGIENGRGSLRVFDFATAKLLGEYRGHRQWGQNLVVSPDGKTIASTSWANPTTGELRLWQVGNFQPIATVPVPGENNYVAAGAVSPDGKLLVLGGWGQTLTVWDMTNPAKPVLRQTLKDHKAGLRSVEFSADGSRFVTSDEGGFVKVWDAATLGLVVSWKAADQGVYRAKFTPDGKNIVTCTGNWQARARSELRVWDAATGKETGRFPDQNREVWDIVFLDGGKLMVTSGTISGNPEDGHLKVWDFSTKQVVRTPLDPGSFSMARSLAVSADGKYLALGSAAGPLKVFETATWQEVLSVADLKDVCFRLNFSPDGSSLAVASGDNAAIVIRLPWAK